MTDNSLEGGYSREKIRIETYLKNWLILARVQSLPVSIVTVLLGYATVSNAIYNANVLYLVTPIIFGHLGVYIHNDVVDHKYDIQHKNTDKPLVSGVIALHRAFLVSTILILISVACAYILLNTYSFLAYILAAILGIIYNYTSKIFSLSSLFLGAWGVSIVFIGGLYAGTINNITIIIAGIIFLHMILMTIAGDLKDLNSIEPNIPRLLDCKYKQNCNITILPQKFKIVWLTLNIIEFSMVSYLLNHSFNTIIFLTLSIIGIIAITLISIFIINSVENKFKSRRAKKFIVLRELLLVGTVIIASYTFISSLEIFILLIVSFVWGLSWLKILFGDWLYFA